MKDALGIIIVCALLCVGSIVFIVFNIVRR